MRKILLVFAFVFLMISCGSTQNIYQNSPRKVSSNKVEKSQSKNPTLADKIIWTAVSYKGTPYRYGGTTKSGMDCSGLIMTSFSKRGVSLPRSSSAMSKKGYKISLRQTKRGDLLFFRTNRRTPSKITHVGLVTHVKNGVVHFIHASSSRGVTVNNMSQRYYKKNFAYAKRVL